MVGHQVDRLSEGLDGLVVFVLLQVDDPQIVPCIEVVRVLAQRGFVGGNTLARHPFQIVNPAEIHVHRRHRRRQRGRAPECIERTVKIAGILTQQAQLVEYPIVGIVELCQRFVLSAFSQCGLFRRRAARKEMRHSD